MATSLIEDETAIEEYRNNNQNIVQMHKIDINRLLLLLKYKKINLYQML